MLDLNLYMDFAALLDRLSTNARDGIDLHRRKDTVGVKRCAAEMAADCKSLIDLTRRAFGELPPKNQLGRHAGFSLPEDFESACKIDLPAFRAWIDEKFRGEGRRWTSFDSMLDPLIVEVAIPQYLNGHYREAVLNAIVGVFDLIRHRTGKKSDGCKLIDEVFRVDDPLLMFSDVETETGQSDQKGGLSMLKGAYMGIRNTKSHSLSHNLDPVMAAQYLVFASILARKVRNATTIRKAS